MRIRRDGTRRLKTDPATPAVRPGRLSEEPPTMPGLDPIRLVTWQGENCLTCKWFRPADPINADILSNGGCAHPKLLPFNFVISGRDWCNLFEVVTQRQIDAMQERAMKKE